MMITKTDDKYSDFLSKLFGQDIDEKNLKSEISKHKHEKLVNKPFVRNTNNSLINGKIFKNEELDQLLYKQKPLYYFTMNKDGIITDQKLSMIVIGKQYQKSLTNSINVRYQTEKKGNKMESKVVGTSFKMQEQGPIKFDDIAGTLQNVKKDGVPVKVGQALLMPDKNNKYDKNAVKVIAKLTDGSPYDLGFLPKNSNACLSVKKPTLAKLLAYGYSTVGAFNDSYAVKF